VDTLVLGCTHYPLLKPLLQRVMGPGVRLIDSGEETAAAVVQALEAGSLTAPAGATATHRFAVSDDEARFRQVGARFIGERMGRAEVVPLG
jgi:glutamate racemase